MRVYMRDHNLVRRGKLPVLAGSAHVRLNDVSTFEFTIDANTDTWRRFQPGWGVIVEDNGRVLSGIARPVSTERDASGALTLKLSGVCDNRLLRDMITLPNPARAADQQDTDAYYVRRNQPAERVMRDMIHALIGPAARPEYRIDRLTVPASQGRGSSVSVNTRFKPLLEELQALAVAGGVNFRVDQVGRGLVVSFWEGRDLSRAIRLTDRSGAVGAYTLTQEPPSVTEVIVAGQGEGAARTILRVTGNASPWGERITRFQDRRDTDEAADLRQAGEETLADGQEKASLSFTATDVPGRRFLTDFTIGDVITVQLDTGVVVTDVVQAAEITWSETGREVKLQVGPVMDEESAPDWVKPVRTMARAIRGLQTT